MPGSSPRSSPNLNAMRARLTPQSVKKVLTQKIEPTRLLKRFLGIHRVSSISFVEKIETINNLQIVRLKGDIDMTTVPGIERMIIAAKKNRGLMEKNILLDFQNVGHVDSSTIAALLVMITDLKNQNHRLGLVHISPRLEKILSVLDVRDLFTIYRTENLARKDLV